MRLSERAQFLIDNLDLEAASGVPGARWEFFQIALFSDSGTFRSDNKSRQIAYSWTISADGMADALLEGRDAVYISINQREAQEKVRYALAVYEHLQIAGLPRIRRQTMEEIELSNGARLTSLPSQKPRGRARANLYLDEFAHIRGDESIYTAALPIISKGGRLRVGSSPFGGSGRFWEIHTQAIRAYPGYTRRTTPWWETYAFSTHVREARRLAPTQTTWERVEAYGNERIRAIFANIPLEDFQQEYEGIFVDASRAWITWDEIKKAQDPGLLCELAVARPGSLQEAHEAIRTVHNLIHTGRVEAVLAGGLDVGRTRNTSELYFIGWGPAQIYPLRLGISMDMMDFDSQAAIIDDALSLLPVAGLLIDRNGIGRNLAESMERAHPGIAVGVDFTNASKTKWATDAKTLIQQNRTPLPVDKDLAYQIHSIKRRVSANRNLIFDTETAEKHHADKFWGWALALANTQGERLESAHGALLEAFSL